MRRIVAFVCSMMVLWACHAAPPDVPLSQRVAPIEARIYSFQPAPTPAPLLAPTPSPNMSSAIWQNIDAWTTYHDLQTETTRVGAFITRLKARVDAQHTELVRLEQTAQQNARRLEQLAAQVERQERDLVIAAEAVRPPARPMPSSVSSSISMNGLSGQPAPSSTSDIRWGNTEIERKQIYQELGAAELRAIHEADNLYPDFGEKHQQYAEQKGAQYAEVVIQKYHLTDEQQRNLSIEAYKKGWRQEEQFSLPARVQPKSTIVPATQTTSYSCSQKTCEEMISCDEARFQLTQCGNTSLDRDGDGVPCESLCR